MRVRGLKHDIDDRKNTVVLVAPHAGAWIETGPISESVLETVSHPMRVRGLKLMS